MYFLSYHFLIAISGKSVNGVRTEKFDLDSINVLISLTPVSACGLPIRNVKSLEILSHTSPPTVNFPLTNDRIGWLSPFLHHSRYCEGVFICIHLQISRFSHIVWQQFHNCCKFRRQRCIVISPNRGTDATKWVCK